MYKLGLYAWFGGNVSIEHRFKAIKEVGFDCVSLYWGQEYEPYIGKNEETIKLVQEKYNLEVENLHAPYSTASDIFSDDDDLAQKTIDIYLKTIKDAAKFNVPVVVIHLTGDIIDSKVNFKGVLRVQQLVDTAKKYNIKLAFENLRKEGLPHLHAVLEYYQDKCVGFCYDIGHAHVFSDDTFEILKQYQNRLYAMHLHGNHKDWDYHKRLVDSNIDLNKLKELFKEIKPQCPISLEVIQDLDINEYNSFKKYVEELKNDCLLVIE